MKVLYSWLREFIPIELPAHQVAEFLIQLGIEVESVAPLPLGFENVVVAEVIAVTAHPEAERLAVATATDGTERWQVVCGAPNCQVGLKTALAKVGARLTDSDGKTVKVKKGKLRGIESHGMLCSEKELGLGAEHSGIIAFAPQIPLGADVAEIYADTLFDISLTPNLGHCASLLGLARELSAVTRAAVTPPLYADVAPTFKARGDLRVEVESSTLCPLYSCRVVKGVAVAPSPAWLQSRLLASGLRPVNNVVDITNYVLLEFGHPIHAFDLQKIEGQQLKVRMAVEGESITTLDGKERALTSEDLVIADSKKPVAIAGIMGGASSEVGDETRDLLIESALFDPVAVRKGSQRQKLQTEASRRFERGCDPEGVSRALDRAVALIDQLIPGTSSSEQISVGTPSAKDLKVTCRLSRVNGMLGTQLSASELEEIFQKVGFAHGWDGLDLFTVMIPSYRLDLHTEIDLIEEVAKIYGYNNIPKIEPRYISSSIPDATIYLFENEVRGRLLACGLQEFITCDLIGPTALKVLPSSPTTESLSVSVLNPTSIEQSQLRTSLLPGLLQVAKNNWDMGSWQLSGFEIGRIHFKNGEQYKELTLAGILLAGTSLPHHWTKSERAWDFYDLKGVVEDLFEGVELGAFSFGKSDNPSFHPGRQAVCTADGVEIGYFGELHPEVMRRLDYPERLFFAEINLQHLYQKRSRCRMMRELPKYPATSRDVTWALPQELLAQDVVMAIKNRGFKYLEEVAVIDLYSGEKSKMGCKNVTFRCVYRDRKKTLSQDVVDAEQKRLSEWIESQFLHKRELQN